MQDKKQGLCGICPAGCWITAEMKDGRISKVSPQADHPLGMICNIGKHSADVIYDPDRLKYPMRRVGPKGTYEFERITWDEAYAAIVDNLEQTKAKHGAEATAIYTGRGSFDLAMCDVYQPQEAAVSSASSVLFPFGSPNTLGVGALCYVSFAMIAPDSTLGEMLVTMDADLDQSELIFLWGANPATDSPPLAHRQILAARERGAEIVSIDPRRNGTARQTGAEWVPIRPGTDGALALSMIQVLIEEELYDEDFVRDWTLGFESLADLTQHYRPQVAEGITGVPAETIRSLARRLASARGAAPVMYTGLEYSDSGVQAIRAVLTLWALAGQLDVPGGWTIRMRENAFPQNRTGLIANPDVKKALGRDRFPVYSAYRGESHAISLPDAVLREIPYKIRSLIILGGSIITSWPNPSKWRETMAALDFLVTINRYHTADSAYADIVLPATTQYETVSYMRYGPMFKIREKMIEPVGEARNDFFILAELAKRLGYGHLYPQTEDELLSHALEGTGFTLEEVRANGGQVQVPTVMMEYKKWEKGRLRPDGEVGFNTPSGKFEIESSLLEEHGYESLPVYTEPREGPLARPDLAEKYPLVFNSGTRTHHDFRSQHHGVSSLAKKSDKPLVFLHAEDAASRGIDDGDPVFVRTPRGQVKYWARVTSDIVKGAVDAQMGGGGPLGSKAWQQCNANELTDLERYDPISGFPVYKTLLCDVLPADGDSVAFESDDQDENNEVTTVTDKALRQVYLDNNATTVPAQEVTTAMLSFLRDSHGNPSSIHSRGNDARDAVEAARRKLAQLINTTARRIVFTGSGSEANNLAIHGYAAANPQRRHLITTSIEHPAVLKPCQVLAQRGYELTVLPVDGNGRVSLRAFQAALREDTLMASVMFANNEVGTIQDIAAFAARCHEVGAVFHTDGVQALGKLPIDVDALGVDMMSMSAHKLHGPKGVGALYVRKGVELSSLIWGGGHERGLRAGTENVPGIVGFGVACELASQQFHRGAYEEVQRLRDRVAQVVLDIVPDAQLNGDPEFRLPNTVNFTLPAIRGESLVLALDRYGVYFSSGSACKSGNPAPSHVLLALGMTEEQAHCAIRLSLSCYTTDEDVDYVADALRRVLAETKNSVKFVSCR